MPSDDKTPSNADLPDNSTSNSAPNISEWEQEVADRTRERLQIDPFTTAVSPTQPVGFDWIEPTALARKAVAVGVLALVTFGAFLTLGVQPAAGPEFAELPPGGNPGVVQVAGAQQRPGDDGPVVGETVSSVDGLRLRVEGEPGAEVYLIIDGETSTIHQAVVPVSFDLPMVASGYQIRISSLQTDELACELADGNEVLSSASGTGVITCGWAPQP